MVPVLAAIALVFGVSDPVPWRRVVLASGVALMLSLSVLEWLRARRYLISAGLVPMTLLLSVLAQLLVLIGSGGLFSPVLPAVTIMATFTSLLANRATLRALLCLIIPTLWLLALVHTRGWLVPSLLPPLFGSGSGLEHGPAPWIAAAVLTVMVGASARFGSSLQHLFEDLLAEAMQERDRSLALHAEQTRTLSLFTAEIAHELKNPLASIKGLSTLMAKDVQGKAAERIAVLRGEVDRMQATLEEFLNFSRPVVPMSVSPADLGAIVRDVVRLHEGTALERGVTIELSGAHTAPVECDQRKIRQVIINLVQNALDVSPRGSTIEVQINAVQELHRVRILDRGAGISPQISLHEFKSGLTTKDQGSGLGLVVARSLARQHGGDVDLSARAGGGALAMLTLPRTPKDVGP
jgi:two-component system sensor histidine kinase HydH